MAKFSWNTEESNIHFIPPHYYGDAVRRLFLAGAVLMAATLPFFSGDIYEPLPLSLSIIIILIIAAGFTSPRYFLSAAVNVIISAGAVLIFEWYAVQSYIRFGGADNFFWTNQILSLIFLIALYYGVKTVREFR